MSPTGPSPIIVALRRAYLSARTALEAELQGSGLTASQLEVLKILMRPDDLANPAGGPLDQRALQASMDVTSATLTRLLTGMESRGLIRRTAHPSDSRGKQVSASPRARKLHASILAQGEAAFTARMLAGLSPSESRTLCNLLDRVAENMRR